MMRRVTRYVLIELISVFSVTLTGITMLLILAGVANVGVREGLGFGPLLRMVPYVVPVALQISVPATILMSCCSVFGRMSADNEILAIKSLGISPMAVMVPAFGMAVVVSFVAVWINDIAVSWGRTGIYSVVIDSVEIVGEYDVTQLETKVNKLEEDAHISMQNTILSNLDSNLVKIEPSTISSFGGNMSKK